MCGRRRLVGQSGVERASSSWEELFQSIHEWPVFYLLSSNVSASLCHVWVRSPLLRAELFHDRYWSYRVRRKDYAHDQKYPQQIHHSVFSGIDRQITRKLLRLFVSPLRHKGNSFLIKVSFPLYRTIATWVTASSTSSTLRFSNSFTSDSRTRDGGSSKAKR